MKEKIIYLDTSAIVKRYVEEPGGDVVRSLYRNAYDGEIKLAFSTWNVGEVLGVFDRALMMGRINREDHATARKRFLIELNRLTRLGALTLIHLKVSILKEAWKLIEKYHIYQADALQITSAKALNAEQIVVSDKKLCELSLREGLNTLCVE
ncbi:MAG: type II toxin-antitoxin system VapC family toxin [Nitrososphaerota archaeon]